MSPSHGLTALLAAGALIVSGDALRRVFGLRATCGPERLGLALALGTVWLTLCAIVLSAAGPFAGLTALSVALLLPVVALPFSRRRPRDPHSWRVGWLGFLPALAVALFALWLAWQRPVWNIDAEKRWVMHARWLASEHTLLPERVRDPVWITTYPHYPPLVPCAVALALDFGADPDRGARPLFPFFFLALLGLLHGQARRVLGERSAGALTCAFALTPCFAWLDHRGNALGLGADSALADVPLALFVAGLALYALRTLDDARGADARACALLAVGAVWCKREGIASALAILLSALAVALARRRSPGWRPPVWIGLCALACLAAFALWTFLTREFPVEPGSEGAALASLSAVRAGLDRLPEILRATGREIADVRTWGLLWLSSPLWLAAAVVRDPVPGARRRALLCGVWMCAGPLLGVLAYLTTSWRGGDFVLQMELSTTRLWMHHAPIAALLAIEACRSRERAGAGGGT